MAKRIRYTDLLMRDAGRTKSVLPWPLLLCALAILFSLQAKASVYQPFSKQPVAITCAKLKPVSKATLPESHHEIIATSGTFDIGFEPPQWPVKPLDHPNDFIPLPLKKTRPHALFFRPPPFA